MNPIPANYTVSPLVEAMLEMVGITSAPELEKRLESGHAVMEERQKKRRRTAERKEIRRRAKGLVSALLCAHGANTAAEGSRTEVISNGIDSSLADILLEVFPNVPREGPAAGFPSRQLRRQIREMHESGKIDDTQAQVLICAVRQAANAIAGDHGRTPRKKTENENHDAQREKTRIFRGPRKVTETTLSRMPETIRAAANRLKAKPARNNPEYHLLSESLLADCASYFGELDLAGKGVGRRLTDYADALRKHEHDRGDEERILEWLVQFPVAPPDSFCALLFEKFEWMRTEEKYEGERRA